MNFITKYRKLADLLTILLLFTGVTMISWGKTAALPQGSYLTAVQMTDHTLTGEDLQYLPFSLNAAMGTNGAHVLWREQNTANTGKDLFYRSLPNGTTQRLSNSSAGNNTIIFHQSITVSAADIPHVIWEEYTSSVDSRDINYWNPIDGIVSLVSQTPTQGYATFWPLLWLEGDNAHIVWQQRNAAQTDDVFVYWNSVSKTAVELPGFEAGLVHNGVLHITWEGSFNGPVNYWNSSDQMTVSLPNSTTVGDASVHQKGIFADPTGQIIIFFNQSWQGDPVTTCLASWNNVAQTTTVHVTGNNCFSLAPVQVDAHGVFHTFGIDSNSGFWPFYWNSDLANAISFDTSSIGTGFGIGNGDLYLAENGRAHILWEDDNDLYHWNPDNLQIVNLSASSGANTTISSYLKYRSLDMAGNLHVFWQEQTAPGSSMASFYWYSAEQITTNLLTKLGFDSIEFQSLTDTVSPAPVLRIYGVSIIEGAGAYYWNIAEDTITPVWYGPDVGGLGTYFSYTDKPGNGVLTSWIDPADYLFVVKSSENGIQIMNQTATDDTGNLVYITEFDDFGNIYTVWTEMSDSSGEGLDFFAAWSTDFVEGSANLYLPFVTK